MQWVYHPGHKGFFTHALAALGRGETIRLVTDQTGSPTPADLLASALMTCAARPVAGLFHLATSGEVSAWGWIERAAAISSTPFQADAIKREDLDGAYRPARSCLDSTRFAHTWGVRLPPWDTALAQAFTA